MVVGHTGKDQIAQRLTGKLGIGRGDFEGLALAVGVEDLEAVSNNRQAEEQGDRPFLHLTEQGRDRTFAQALVGRLGLRGHRRQRQRQRKRQSSEGE